MTPQAFSYPTLASNDKIYIPPYGLNKSINYMLVMDTKNYNFKKIPLKVSDCTEKWQHGITLNKKIYFLPYNEENILVVDTDDDSIEYIPVPKKGKGKYIQGHIYQNKIYALPYGEHEPYKYILILDLLTHEVNQIEIIIDNDDEKKWHQTQIIDHFILGLPRGESLDLHFNYGIKFDCDTCTYKLLDLNDHWSDYDQNRYCNKKFTTMAKVGDKLFSPPYSEDPNFDILAIYDNGWQFIRTNIQSDSRKYYSHTLAKNGKIYFPPAGHEEEWSLMLIINGTTKEWYTKDLKLGKESKKYFTGVENSQGKIYYIPRGGCICSPVNLWKKYGDLVEILVVDTKDDSYYTINIGEFFVDNTTIEKYNQCVIKDDIIYAFPYGESETFQTVLIFDTLKEKVIKTIDLNEI